MIRFKKANFSFFSFFMATNSSCSYNDLPVQKGHPQFLCGTGIRFLTVFAIRYMQ